LHLALEGRHQIDNAAVAMRLLEQSAIAGSRFQPRRFVRV
jgi:hypothetical protein